jgi:hypothetical protein
MVSLLYTAMTFDLKNAGMTYQKAIHKCLESQIGDNVEVYVDDVIVKTMVEDNLDDITGSSTQRSASLAFHLASF